MPLGQARDHVQAHPARHGHVQVRRVGEPVVGLGELLVRHAHAPVGDLHRERVPSRDHRPHADLGLRFGEVGRVVQQLGQQVHEVVHRTAVHADLGNGAQFHTGVLLDLRDRGTDDVGGGDRLGHRLGQARAGKHQQALAVAPQPGGEVVQLEQTGELVGVLLVGFEPVDDAELAFDEALAAPREVDEDAVDVLPQQGLLGGQPDGPLVHHVERAGDLADLLAGPHRHRRDRVARSLDRVGVGQDAPHRLRKPHVGDLERARPQRAQGTRQRPGDDERQQDRGDQRGDHQPEEQPRRTGRVGGEGLRGFPQSDEELPFDLPRHVHGGLAVEGELVGVDVYAATRACGAVVRGGDLPCPVVHLRTGDPVEVELLLAEAGVGVEGVDGGVGAGLRRAAAVEQVGDEPVVPHGDAEHGVLPGGVLLGLGDRLHGRAPAQQFPVGHREVHRAAEPDQRLDDRVVGGVGRQVRVSRILDLVAQRAERIEALERPVEGPPGLRAAEVPARDRVAQLPDGVVHGADLRVDRAVVTPRARQRGDGESALPLEFVDHGGDLLGDLDLRDGVAELVRLAQRLDRPQTAEHQRRDERHQQDDGELVAQRPVAQPPPRRVTGRSGLSRPGRRLVPRGLLAGGGVLGGVHSVPVRGFSLRHRSTTIVVRAGSLSGILAEHVLRTTHVRATACHPSGRQAAEAWRQPPIRVNMRSRNTHAWPSRC